VVNNRSPDVWKLFSVIRDGKRQHYVQNKYKNKLQTTQINKQKNTIGWGANKTSAFFSGSKGEFIFQGDVGKGSHMMDLHESITASHKITDDRRSPGWRQFLKALQASTFHSRVYQTVNFANRFKL
jgi:uncharacterized protein with gpF-like domain